MDQLSVVEDVIDRYVEDGDVLTALHLYRTRLGEFRGIAWHRADYRLGLRLTDRMVRAGGVTLEGAASVRPWYDRALYHLALGNLRLAEMQLKVLEADLEQEREEIVGLRHVTGTDVDDDWLERFENYHAKRPASSAPGRMTPAAIDALFRPALLESLSDVLLAQGRLIEAERYAQRTIDAVPSEYNQGFMYDETGASPYGRRAAARFLLGKVNEAWSDLDEADKSSFAPESFGGMQRYYRLQVLIRQGKLVTAARLLELMDLPAVREECPLLWASYSRCEAEIQLAKGATEAARPILELVMNWAETTGHMETWIRGMLATARVHMQQGAASVARLRLDGVQSVTRENGFALGLIEALILEAHRCLMLENLIGAEEATQEADALSCGSETGYAWGSASSAHLFADIRLRQGRFEEAQTFAQRACTLRTSLGDARLSNSQALLGKAARE